MGESESFCFHSKTNGCRELDQQWRKHLTKQVSLVSAKSPKSHPGNSRCSQGRVPASFGSSPEELTIVLLFRRPRKPKVGVLRKLSTKTLPMRIGYWPSSGPSRIAFSARCEPKAKRFAPLRYGFD